MADMSASEAEQSLDVINRLADNIRQILLDLEQRNGYKALGYPSMHAMLQDRFMFGKSQMYRELAAAKIESGCFQPIGERPESHLRELVPLESLGRHAQLAALIIGDQVAELLGTPARAAYYRAAAETVQEMDLTGGYVTIDENQVHVTGAAALNKLAEDIKQEIEHVRDREQARGRTRILSRAEATIDVMDTISMTLYFAAPIPPLQIKAGCHVWVSLTTQEEQKDGGAVGIEPGLGDPAH